MDYAINHVHIRAKEPKVSAAWYEKIFNAKIVSEREVMPGTITIGMQVGGPTRLNISSQPPNSSPERAVPELHRLGLEHFGFHVDDLEAEMARFEAEGIRVILPLTVTPQGIKLAYIEGPDDVVIELVQPAA